MKVNNDSVGAGREAQALCVPTSTASLTTRQTRWSPRAANGYGEMNKQTKIHCKVNVTSL